MGLRLVASNEWTLIPTDKTPNQIFHKEYGNDKHGLVFIDEHGLGNAIILDSGDNCLGLHETSSTCFNTLKFACDKIFNDLKMKVGVM